MGVSIQQLRERRAAIAAQARKLMDDTKDSKWTNENQSKYDELTGEDVPPLVLRFEVHRGDAGI